MNGILIASIYAPNDNPQPGPKFDYKLTWMGRFTRHVTAMRKTAVLIILAGDSTSLRLTTIFTTSWKVDALIQPESRAAFKKLVGRSWIDSIRVTHPDERIYTFWHYMRNRWARDAGLRTGHLLVSPSVAPRLVDTGVDRSVRGEDGASDHAPVWIESE